MMTAIDLKYWTDRAEQKEMSVPQAIESFLISSALERAGGCYRAAAEILKMPRSTLYDRAGRYGLRREERHAHPSY